MKVVTGYKCSAVCHRIEILPSAHLLDNKLAFTYLFFKKSAPDSVCDPSAYACRELLSCIIDLADFKRLCRRIVLDVTVKNARLLVLFYLFENVKSALRDFHLDYLRTKARKGVGSLRFLLGNFRLSERNEIVVLHRVTRHLCR